MTVSSPVNTLAELECMRWALVDAELASFAALFVNANTSALYAKAYSLQHQLVAAVAYALYSRHFFVNHCIYVFNSGAKKINARDSCNPIVTRPPSDRQNCLNGEKKVVLGVK